MRLLLAARLSQTHDGQTGLETQDAQVQAWAQANGHVIVHVAADRKSGTSAPWDRPNLRPWVTEPGKVAQYDAVVAYRFDRLSRGDKQSTNAIEAWAHQHGKLLLTEDGLVYPCEGADGIRWDVTARIAHEEWLKTSERYRRMQAHLRGNGYLVGRPPFGFQIVCAEHCGKTGKECKHHKTLAPHSGLKPYVEGMAGRYLSGSTLTAICEWLDSEGIKPSGGGRWQQKTVRDVLSNTALIGRRKDGNGRTVLRFGPILDVVTFKRLQNKLAENPRRGAASPDTALLTGIIFCAKCDRVMYRKVSVNTRKDGSRQTNEYYRCDGTTRDRSTCRNMIPLADADSYVGMWVTDVIGHKKLIERRPVPASGHDEEIDQVELDIRELDLDDPEYDAKLWALRSERKRLKELPAEPAGVIERRTGVTLAEHWASLDTTQAKRAWLLAGEVRVMASKDEFTLRATFGGDWIVG